MKLSEAQWANAQAEDEDALNCLSGRAECKGDAATIQVHMGAVGWSEHGCRRTFESALPARVNKQQDLIGKLSCEGGCAVRSEGECVDGQ